MEVLPRDQGSTVIFLQGDAYSKLPPQQPDDFGYVNNRPRVLRVTNFHNPYLYISVHISIENNTTIIVYSPKGLSLLTSCSGRNFNCIHCLDAKSEGFGLNRFGEGSSGGGGGQRFFCSGRTRGAGKKLLPEAQ